MDRKEDNNIKIGTKPIHNYVTPSTIILQENNIVEILARGNYIVKGIDVAEILKHNFFEIGKRVSEEVKLGTVKMVGHGDKELNVSTIKIILRCE